MIGGEGGRLIRWVEAQDRRFIALLDSDLAAGAERAGSHLACRVGCVECCIGSFSITSLDARRLRHGLAKLRQQAPERADAVLRRAQGAQGSADDSSSCPALDPLTGGCELYDWRPVTCRTFGLPVAIGAERLPPCRLCFSGAMPHAIEHARVTIDAEGDEQAMLAALEQAGVPDQSTTVAAALAMANVARQ